MSNKPLDVPGHVAKAFLADLRAFHAEPNAIKRDEIAARQARLLNQHLKPSKKELRTHDLKDMFERMQDLLGPRFASDALVLDGFAKRIRGGRGATWKAPASVAQL